MAKTSSLTEEEINLQATVMAIREELMAYFKGTYIERVTTNRNVQLVNLQQYMDRPDYSFLRRKLENQRPMLLILGGAPIMSVQSTPEMVTLHTKVLERSPQFREIRKRLEKFMDTYLQGVKREENSYAIFYG